MPHSRTVIQPMNLRPRAPEMPHFGKFKRPLEHMGKKKAAYFQGKKAKNISVPPKGSHGILVTCEPNRTNKATQQVIRMCEEFCEPLDEPEAPPKEMSLEEELQQMRNPKQKSRFISYVSDVPGNVFIRFTEEKDDPFAILNKFFASVREAGSNTLPNVVRVYPIMASGFPRSEESLPVLQTLIPKLFTPDVERTYEVVIQRKHKGDGQKETHDELNQKIVEMVGAPHKAKYHGSDCAILWLSLGRNLYLSVVEQWKEWCGCNIPKFCAQMALSKPE